MHLVSKKDLNSAELETMRISRNPTTVMTANGEVQTREEATVCVKELDKFVTVMFADHAISIHICHPKLLPHGLLWFAVIDAANHLVDGEHTIAILVGGSRDKCQGVPAERRFIQHPPESVTCCCSHSISASRSRNVSTKCLRRLSISNLQSSFSAIPFVSGS